MQTISLKMEDSLLKDIDKNLAKNRYSTRTEFIRGAIRSKLSQLEKEEAIRKLAEMKGSLKGKARMTEEKAKKRALEELEYELKTGKEDVAFARLAKQLGKKLD